jgi:hypothetical protein
VEGEALEAEKDKELQKQDKRQKYIKDDYGCGSWCEVQREGLDEKEGDSEFVHDEEKEKENELLQLIFFQFLISVILFKMILPLVEA